MPYKFVISIVKCVSIPLSEILNNLLMWFYCAINQSLVAPNVIDSQELTII